MGLPGRPSTADPATADRPALQGEGNAPHCAYNICRSIRVDRHHYRKAFPTMKRLSLSLPLLLVLAAAPGRTIGQDPKPAPAIVTMTDTVTGMSKLDKDKMELRLNNAPGKGSILTAPLVLVD